MNLFPGKNGSNFLDKSIVTERSVFGKALEDVLARNLDENCDGWATDRELFDQMKTVTVPYIWLGASFRFRSSAWSDIPLVPARKQVSSCQTCRERVQRLGSRIGVLSPLSTRTLRSTARLTPG